MNDPYRLQRFVDAQDPVLDAVLSELGSGAKRSHWMWFVFPQIAALGQSSTARHFAIASMDEAKAYLAHPTLAQRLRRCAGLANAVQDRSAFDVFGSPDDRKFHSSMTLFRLASGGEHVFSDALDRFFDGRDDAATLAVLARADAAR